MAAAKTRALLQAGATVSVVALKRSEEMERLVSEFQLAIAERPFDFGDLNGVWIVVAATDDPEVHQQIFEEARRRNILVCIVDDPARSDFIVPAVLRRGELLVTVSTSGVAPALASRIRDDLAEILGPAYSAVVEDLKGVRERLMQRYPDFARRREAWYRLLDRHVLPALRRGSVPDPAGTYLDDEEKA